MHSKKSQKFSVIFFFTEKYWKINNKYCTISFYLKKNIKIKNPVTVSKYVTRNNFPSLLFYFSYFCNFAGLKSHHWWPFRMVINFFITVQEFNEISVLLPPYTLSRQDVIGNSFQMCFPNTISKFSQKKFAVLIFLWNNILWVYSKIQKCNDKNINHKESKKYK